MISLLIHWYKKHARNLPWRIDSQPYHVWVSEIILQQTQMSRGVDYFQRFIKQFPDVYSLASADEHDVLLLWQGLGYYSRARHMHTAAQQIVNQFDGKIPDDYEQLRSLKGIGDYTACAILSIAFRKPFAVADGNVLRVVSRMHMIELPVDRKSTVEIIKNEVLAMMQGFCPSDVNQALMELGALVCTHAHPDCYHCPFSSSCKAFASQRQNDFPVKRKALPKTMRYFHYFIFIDDADSILLYKREDNDIWKGLYEFPLIETESSEAIQVVKLKKMFAFLKKEKFDNPQFVFNKVHILTHQYINSFFYKVQIKSKHVHDASLYVKTSFSRLKNYPIHNLMKWAVSSINEKV